MSKHLQKVQPLINELDEYLHEVGPEYLIYPTVREGRKSIVVEVQDGPSENVVWDIKDGKMVKTFDFEELPF